MLTPHDELDTMQTYIAEIDGAPTVAFRAEDDEHAQVLADDDNGGLRLSLSDVEHPDGRRVWDGSSPVVARRATKGEHSFWLQALEANIGDSAEGPVIDPAAGDDLNDFNCYLIDAVDPYAGDDE
jgi:hypothetical protein